MSRKQVIAPEDSKQGFTLIEVMLVLGLSGLLLIGLIGGTFSAVARQRYNDTVRSFVEYLRNVYGEVQSPQSLGAGNSKDYAIFGKLLVVDNSNIYSATVIGSADIPRNVDGGFIDELAAVEAELYCGQPIDGTEQASTFASYSPLWQAELAFPNADGHNVNQPFTGSIIIARAPTSGTVHTIFIDRTYDLVNDCRDATNSSAGSELKQDLKNFSSGTDPHPDISFKDIGFCLKSENSPLFREVRIAADGRNTSAITVLDTDGEGAGVNRCL